MSSIKWVDCTSDDYKDEIQQWQLKRQKLLNNEAEHAMKEKEYDEDMKRKDLEGKKVLLEWREQQKSFYNEMSLKRDELKKGDESLCEEAFNLVSEGRELKETVISQLKTSFDASFKHSSNLSFVKEYIYEAYGLLNVCNVCGLDLSPLLYTPNVIGALSTNCLECGYFLCNTCVLKGLLLNEANIHSIGYECPNCKFFNCNTVNLYSFNEKQQANYNPIVSGVSTSERPHLDGRVLNTSNPTKISHINNVSVQMKYNEYKKNKNNNKCNCFQCIGESKKNNNKSFRYQDSDDSSSSHNDSIHTNFV